MAENFPKLMKDNGNVLLIQEAQRTPTRIFFKSPHRIIIIKLLEIKNNEKKLKQLELEKRQKMCFQRSTIKLVTTCILCVDYTESCFSILKMSFHC